MSWMRYRSRPLLGLVLMVFGVGFLVEASGLTTSYEFDPSPIGFALSVAFIGAAVMVWRKVI